jgi:DNA-binding transcriptional LysR family regulator
LPVLQRLAALGNAHGADVVDSKGEVVAVSHKLEHPMLTLEPLAPGRLRCIVPQSHPLARRERVSADEIVQYPLIGIDPNDPYGRIMAGIFSSHALSYEVTIRARFGSTTRSFSSICSRRAGSSASAV